MTHLTFDPLYDKGNVFAKLCDIFGVDPRRVDIITINPKDDVDDSEFPLRNAALYEISYVEWRPTVQINDCQERPITNAQMTALNEMRIL